MTDKHKKWFWFTLFWIHFFLGHPLEYYVANIVAWAELIF